MKLNTLWREALRNLFLSALLFVALIGLCFLIEYFSHLPLLRWDDWAFIVGIPASIVGVGYVLTIRNPANYTGFYIGILMSLLLALQFFLQQNYDLTVLYVAIFVPFQIKSILTWKHPKQHSDEPFQPEFLSLKKMLWSLVIFVLITALDYVFASLVMAKDGLGANVLIKIMSGLLISSSVLANFWLIYKKNDAWIYWVVYSVAGIVFYILINNIFSVVLFLFFLIINGMAGISWIRGTDKAHRGWLNGSKKA